MSKIIVLLFLLTASSYAKKPKKPKKPKPVKTAINTNTTPIKGGIYKSYTYNIDQIAQEGVFYINLIEIGF